MTNQTKCPHCGADAECRWSTKVLYTCQTVINDDPLGSGQSYECLETERDNLKSKVAAQQELLKEAATSLRDILEIVEQSPTSQGQFWEFCRKTQFAQEVMQKLEEVK